MNYVAIRHVTMRTVTFRQAGSLYYYFKQQLCSDTLRTVCAEFRKCFLSHDLLLSLRSVRTELPNEVREVVTYYHLRRRGCQSDKHARSSVACMITKGAKFDDKNGKFLQ